MGTRKNRLEIHNYEDGETSREHKFISYNLECLLMEIKYGQGFNKVGNLQDSLINNENKIKFSGILIKGPSTKTSMEFLAILDVSDTPSDGNNGKKTGFLKIVINFPTLSNRDPWISTSLSELKIIDCGDKKDDDSGNFNSLYDLEVTSGIYNNDKNIQSYLLTTTRVVYLYESSKLIWFDSKKMAIASSDVFEQNATPI